MLYYWQPVILPLKLSTLSAATLPSYLRQEVKHISFNCRNNVCGQSHILSYGIWWHHMFNGCVIVTSALQLAAAQVVTIITPARWHLHQYSATLDISWGTGSVLTQRGYSNMLNHKHRSLHVTWTFSPQSRIFVKLTSFENWRRARMLSAENSCRKSLLQRTCRSFSVCFSDLDRLQNKNKREKQYKFCEVSSHILLQSRYTLKTTFTVFQKIFTEFAFFKSWMNTS